MPEEQNVQGERWHKLLNQFLKQVMGWEQLGDRNNDIYCEETKGKVGIDSVFTYKRNPHCPQQIIFVEAKTRKNMKALSSREMQKWINRIIYQLEYVPHSREFREKFTPDTDAEYNLGLLGLWIREHETYSHERLQELLYQLDFPPRSKKIPFNICFVSNQTIAGLCAIHEEFESLKHSGNYKDVTYHFPTYGERPSSDGSCIPIETLMSKFVFCKAKKLQRIKGKDEFNEYPACIVFYLGKIEEYHDLRFIGLALKQFQLFAGTEDIDIYTLYDSLYLRNHIEAFQREFQDQNVEFNFERLSITYDLLRWLE